MNRIKKSAFICLSVFYNHCIYLKDTLKFYQFHITNASYSCNPDKSFSYILKVQWFFKNNDRNKLRSIEKIHVLNELQTNTKGLDVKIIYEKHTAEIF